MSLCLPTVRFQVWYLIEAPPLGEEGNMFLARTAELTSDDPPCRFVKGANGRVRKTLNKNLTCESTLKKYASVDDVGLSFEYLAMCAGECLVFSKRTLHMSDPRPHLRGLQTNRLALNFRHVTLLAT